jgi:large subunit ribosomal protein L25
MATASLSATARSTNGKGAARSLRREGRIPAIIYGSARQPQSLSIATREFERLLERVAAESTVIELDVDGTMARTLIREIQRHPVKRDVVHIDFQELVAGEKVVVRIPIHVVGSAEGVRAGGILDQVMREIQIRVDPVNIPRQIDIDVSHLTIGHSLHVGDLTLPEGVEALDDESATIVTVSAPKVEAEPVAGVEAAAPAEPELIRKPKGEEEEGE